MSKTADGAQLANLQQGASVTAEEVTTTQEIKERVTSFVAMRPFGVAFTEIRGEVDCISISFRGCSCFGRESLPSVPETEISVSSADVKKWNEKEIGFDVELPGIEEKDVTFMLRNGVLSLKGEKSERE